MVHFFRSLLVTYSMVEKSAHATLCISLTSSQRPRYPFLRCNFLNSLLGLSELLLPIKIAFLTYLFTFLHFLNIQQFWKPMIPNHPPISQRDHKQPILPPDLPPPIYRRQETCQPILPRLKPKARRNQEGQANYPKQSN